MQFQPNSDFDSVYHEADQSPRNFLNAVLPLWGKIPETFFVHKGLVSPASRIARRRKSIVMPDPILHINTIVTTRGAQPTPFSRTPEALRLKVVPWGSDPIVSSPGIDNKELAGAKALGQRVAEVVARFKLGSGK